MIKSKKNTKLNKRRIKRTYKKNKNNKKNKKYKSRRNMKGGFNSCILSTITEPGFSLPDMNDIKGLKINESNAIIYRPNCNNKGIGDAMVPY